MNLIWIVLAVIAVIVIIIAGIYNSMVVKRNQVTNAFGSIDAMLKKRFDLIPNLVATVKEYSKHEQETLTKLTQYRTKGYENLNDSEKADMNRGFESIRKGLSVTVENYPDLKASENFMQLQRTLNETEEQLSASRRTYNAAVTDYNNTIQTFPNNIFAGMFNFSPKQVLETAPEERENPSVKQLFQ